MYTYVSRFLSKSLEGGKKRVGGKKYRCTFVRDTRHRVEYVRLRASYEFN